jgi:hypothetical protein
MVTITLTRRRVSPPDSLRHKWTLRVGFRLRVLLKCSLGLQFRACSPLGSGVLPSLSDTATPRSHFSPK